MEKAKSRHGCKLWNFTLTPKQSLCTLPFAIPSTAFAFWVRFLFAPLSVSFHCSCCSIFKSFGYVFYLLIYFCSAVCLLLMRNMFFSVLSHRSTAKHHNDQYTCLVPSSTTIYGSCRSCHFSCQIKWADRSTQIRGLSEVTESTWWQYGFKQWCCSY